MRVTIIFILYGNPLVLMATKTFKTGRIWSIGTKKYSISNPSAIIALKYGKNVSRGILEMQKKIVEQEEEISTMGAWIGDRV